MRKTALCIGLALVLSAAAWADDPASITAGTIMGDITASSVAFDTWMNKCTEFVYDGDPVFGWLTTTAIPDDPATTDDDESVPPCDVNGIISENANGMEDSIEFALLTAVCNDTTNPKHALCHEAFKTNMGKCATDLGSSVGMLCSALKIPMAAYATLGDGSYDRWPNPQVPYNISGSYGILAYIIFEIAAENMGSKWTNGAPTGYDLSAKDFLSACGDFDEDGVANINEFYAAGGDRAAYIAAAMDPQVTATAEDPKAICSGAPGIEWGVNFWYNPTNKSVYHLPSVIAPWIVCEGLAEICEIGGTSLPGKLATVETEAENTWIKTNIRDAVEDDFWLGGTDQATEGTWKWIATGTTFWQGTASGSAQNGLFANWGAPIQSGEPNDSSGEDYCEMNDNGSWNDNKSDETLQGLIEWTNDGAGYDDVAPADGIPDFFATLVQPPEGEGEGEGEEGEGEGEVEPPCQYPGMFDAQGAGFYDLFDELFDDSVKTALGLLCGMDSWSTLSMEELEITMYVYEQSEGTVFNCPGDGLPDAFQLEMLTNAMCDGYPGLVAAYTSNKNTFDTAMGQVSGQITALLQFVIGTAIPAATPVESPYHAFLPTLQEASLGLQKFAMYLTIIAGWNDVWSGMIGTSTEMATTFNTLIGVLTADFAELAPLADIPGCPPIPAPFGLPGGMENWVIYGAAPGKAVGEPFSGEGDFDGDTISNADEYAAVVGAYPGASQETINEIAMEAITDPYNFWPGNPEMPVAGLAGLGLLAGAMVLGGRLVIRKK